MQVDLPFGESVTKLCVKCWKLLLLLLLLLKTTRESLLRCASVVVWHKRTHTVGWHYDMPIKSAWPNVWCLTDAHLKINQTTDISLYCPLPMVVWRFHLFMLLCVQVWHSKWNFVCLASASEAHSQKRGLQCRSSIVQRHLTVMHSGSHQSVGHLCFGSVTFFFFFFCYSLCKLCSGSKLEM